MWQICNHTNILTGLIQTYLINLSKNIAIFYNIWFRFCRVVIFCGVLLSSQVFSSLNFQKTSWLYLAKVTKSYQQSLKPYSYVHWHPNLAEASIFWAGTFLSFQYRLKFAMSKFLKSNFAYCSLAYPKSLLKFCNQQLLGKPESDSLKDWMSNLCLISLKKVIPSQKFHTYIYKFCNVKILYSWKIVFWVFPRRLSIKSRRFGTLCRFHLQQMITSSPVEDGTDTVFRNVGF
jgi:hypothetical protein